MSDITLKQIQECAQAFMQAGIKYKELCDKARLDVGAVLWYESELGLVVITRSEYKDTIFRNIPEVGRVYSLGGVGDVT